MLDPKDWDAFRELSHVALDDALDYLESVRERPVWQEVPDHVRARLQEPLPLRRRRRSKKSIANSSEMILPYRSGNIHPRFFGWVQERGRRPARSPICSRQ